METWSRLASPTGAAPSRDFTVSGTVSYTDGTPVVGVCVQAFDQDLRFRQALGEADTDRAGKYNIRYTRDRFARAEKDSADLVLCIIDDEGTALFATAFDDILFNAPINTKIDVTIPLPPNASRSEFQTILSTLKPLLDSSGLDSPASLREDDKHRDVTFLARETGIGASKMVYVAVSFKLSDLYKKVSPGIAKIPPEFYYGLLAEGTLLQTDLSSSTGLPIFAIELQTPLGPLIYDIVLLGSDTITSAIKAAVANGYVSSSILDRLSAYLRELGTLKDEAQKYKDSQGSAAVQTQVETALKSGQAELIADTLFTDARGNLLSTLQDLQAALSKPTLGTDDGAQPDDGKPSLESQRTPSILPPELSDTALASIMKNFDVKNERDLLRVNRDQLDKALRGVSSHEDANLRALHGDAYLRFLERKYPTAAFAAGLKRDSGAFESHRDVILDLFDRHPDVDLSTVRVESLFPSSTKDFSAAKETVGAFQRLFKVSPKYQHVKALMDSGIRSASKVHSIGEARLLKLVKDGDPSSSVEEAKSIFNRAANITIAASIQAGNLVSLTGATRIAALRPRNLDWSAATQEFPNLKTLFQMGDFCACSECRTVHSAAAYVADTLHYLHERRVVDTSPTPGQPTKSAKQVLFDRRPDLGDMDLSCDNTNTTLPYIDIVCELLEEAVSPDLGIPFEGAVSAGVIPPQLLSALTAKRLPFTANAKIYDPDSKNTLSHDLIARDKRAVAKLRPNGSNSWTVFVLKQTYGPQNEVEAMPQYINQAAYAKLETSTYAFGLPFSLSHLECLAYFNQFNLSRADLMRALQTTTAGPTDVDIASEVLNLLPAEYDLISTSRPASQDTFWNIGSSGTAVENISVVENFVNKTGLSYPDLQELLSFSWINPSASMFIKHLDNSCNLSKKAIAGLDNDALDRFHRFIRLIFKTSIQASILNRLINAKKIGNSSLDSNCLLALADLSRVRARLGLPWEVLSYIFDVLSTDGDSDSPYNHIFLNAAANGKIEDAFTPANLSANEAADPATAKKITDFDSYLALCLGASLADLRALLTVPGTGPILTLKNVSAVYSLAKLSRAMRLPISDLTICLKLTSIDILSSPSTILEFKDLLESIQTSGVSPNDLQYYLLHIASDLSVRDLNDAKVLSILKKLSSGYAAAAVANASPYDDKASPGLNEGLVVDFMSKLPSLSTTDIATFKAMFEGVPWSNATMTAGNFINAKLGDPKGDVKAAQAALAAAPANNNDPQRNALLKAVADLLSAYFLALAKDDILTATVKTELGLPSDLAPVLLQYATLKIPAIPTDASLKDVLEANFPLPPDPSTSVDQARALELLQMMNNLISKMKISADGAKWMLINNPTLGWMRLDRLKYRSDISDVTFESWKALQDVLYLIHTYPPVENPVDVMTPYTVYGLFDLALSPTASVASMLHYLSQLTGLEEAMLSDLSSLFSYDMLAFRAGVTYRKLEKASILLRSLGLSAALGKSAIKPNLGPDDATIMRQALKARYDDADWLGVLKPIQDALRRKKRDALINYILAANPLSLAEPMKTEDDLYDYFLIDVQMGSCMDTSRVVQAHATIQLFVQRCLMGLEPHSNASETVDSRWSEWKLSMASYRLWEISKKLFLFPHAYLNQGMRQDKSEIFSDFESALQQDQLTDNVITSAFAIYLQELQGIAQLDVMACYYQTDTLVMHIFARTKGGDPPKYYYRKFKQERSWTPWQAVNLDITGDTLMAFDRNSRLTLAWPIFTEESDPAQSSQGPPIPVSSQITDPGKPTEKVRKRWKVQLAVSELVDGTWTAKKVSRDALYYPRANAANPFIPVDELEQNYPQDFFIFFPYGGTKLGQAIAAFGPGGWLGAFALTGCSGYPEASQVGYNGPAVLLPQFEDTTFRSGRFIKDFPGEASDLGMVWILSMSRYMHILERAQPKFAVTYPLQLDLLDMIVSILVIFLTSRYKYSNFSRERRGVVYQFGTFMPFFYGDSDRTYTIIPGWYNPPNLRMPDLEPMTKKTYSDIFTLVNDAFNLAVKWLAVFRADPNKDVQKLLKEVQADPDYMKLVDEYKSFRGLFMSFRFRNFYHPLVCALRVAFNGHGIPGLMDREFQLTQTSFKFVDAYKPSPIVHPNVPVEDLDFDPDGAYATYNWELFFHCVYDIAGKLNQDQRFDQAQSWYHYIFNPLGAGNDPAPKKYWVTKPFQTRTDDEYYQEIINIILGKIAKDPLGNNLGNLKAAVLDWRANPFDPWSIAKTRTVEYQIATVLAYVKNLIDWGDSLFRQFTREAVTQATQLYILAHRLLGLKPRIVPPAVETPVQSYNELEKRLDLTGNALMELENLLPDLGDLPHGGAELPPLAFTSLYFCIPPDDNLLSYWNLVDDRLTKIRTCRNIDGVEASLSLFSPPIDFGALSRALAGGMDISSFLGGLSAPLPNYRFQVMVAKAAELAAFATTLGNALLQALEKKDAEALARLKSQDELAVLQAVRNVKVGAITEAKSEVDGLSLTKAISQTKYNWFNSQSYMNAWEITATTLSGASLVCSVAIAVGYALSGGLKLIPSFMAGGAGFGGSPTVNVTMGGSQVGNGAEMATKTIETIATGLDKAAGMATVQAGYRRRQDDWDRERDVAAAEMKEVDSKIVTAMNHYNTAVSDLAAHDKSIENANAEDAFLHSKYTNKELYDWMLTQTSATYLAAYKLAFDMAKKAERCYQLELASDAAFLSFGFDTLKKGLTAAEALQSSINIMQASYLDNNKREYELTKNVSMRLVDPRALLTLRATGKCMFQIPEAIFDLDYPGHYMRRHKNVSISIPCVTGPYTSVCCKLSLINNRFRRTNSLLSPTATVQESYDESTPGGDPRFTYNVGSIQSVATSSCQDDSGLFEANFHDDRYLPFEGTGAIATWQLELPSAYPQFDLNTIADVVFHIRYTAREGGSTLADTVRSIQMDELNNMTNAAKKHGLFQAYSLSQAFAQAWNQLLVGSDNKTSLTLTQASLPFFTRGHGATIDELVLFASLDPAPLAGSLPTQITVAVNGQTPPTRLNPDPSGVKGRFSGSYSGTMIVVDTPFTLQLVGVSAEVLAAMKDMVVLVHYSLTVA